PPRGARGGPHQRAAAGVLGLVLGAAGQRQQPPLAEAFGGAGGADEGLALQHLVDDAAAVGGRARALPRLEAEQLGGQVALLEQGATLHVRQREATGLLDAHYLHDALLSPAEGRPRRGAPVLSRLASSVQRAPAPARSPCGEAAAAVDN